VWPGFPVIRHSSWSFPPLRIYVDEKLPHR
jgi:hypothetical protein